MHLFIKKTDSIGTPRLLFVSLILICCCIEEVFLVGFSFLSRLCDSCPHCCSPEASSEANKKGSWTAVRYEGTLPTS